MHPFEEGRYRLLVVEVLEEVGDVDAVEVIAGQLRLHDRRGDDLRLGLVGGLLVADGVHGPGLLRGDSADELAPSGGRIEDLLRASHQTVDVRPDLPPDGEAAGLVDVAEAVGVEALVVHRGSGLLSGGGTVDQTNDAR